MPSHLSAIYAKLKAFTLERAVPVCLLWFAIALGTLLLPQALDDILSPANAPYRVPLKDFVDHRLFTMLFIGLIVLLVLFSALKLVMTYGEFERRNEANFMARIWDELSAAATHIAFGTLAIWFATSPRGVALPASIALYLVAGLVTFKGPNQSEPPTAA